MRRGSVWLLLLIIIVFITIPAAYWFFGYKNSQESIKGAKTSGSQTGFYVTVNSNLETWDLNSYLCKTKDDCLGSLTSGYKLDTFSGGRVSGHQINFSYNPGWEQYQYLKLFVKSGWGSQTKSFVVAEGGNITGTVVDQVNDDGYKQDVVLIPINSIKDSFQKSAVFSN